MILDWKFKDCVILQVSDKKFVWRKVSNIDDTKIIFEGNCRFIPDDEILIISNESVSLDLLAKEIEDFENKFVDIPQWDKTKYVIKNNIPNGLVFHSETEKPVRNKEVLDNLISKYKGLRIQNI